VNNIINNFSFLAIIILYMERTGLLKEN